MPDSATRFNVQLDEERAEKLRRLAARAHLHPGTLARSLLSTTIDTLSATPDAADVVAILDSIPGALERAHRGRAEARAGRAIPLDEF
jgi:hypothetical protein